MNAGFKIFIVIIFSIICDEIEFQGEYNEVNLDDIDINQAYYQEEAVEHKNDKEETKQENLNYDSDTDFDHRNIKNNRGRYGHPGSNSFDEYDIRRHHRGMGGNSHHSRGNNYNNYGGQTFVDNNYNNNSKSGFFNSFTSSGIYQLLMIMFLGSFIYNCIFGNTQNDKFATNWYQANKQYFEERYEELGITKEQEEENIKMYNTPMIKDSPYLYKYFAAGYRHIKWMLVVLEFRKRNDSTYMLTSAFSANMDKIIYEVAFKPTEEVSWIFCVCKKKDAKYIKQQYQDIDFLCKHYEPSIMSEKICLLSESNFLFCDLFQNKTLLSYFKQIEQHIDIIYCTDQMNFCKEKFSIFFSFDIYLNVSSGQERRLLEITHFVNLFCDTLSQIKFTPELKTEFEKNRILFERNKMEADIRREVERKEREEFIEQWKLRNKMKGKKPKKKNDKLKK